VKPRFRDRRGWLYARLGQYDRALDHGQQALTLHRESGNRGGAADTLDSLGFAYLLLGDLAQAKAHYEQAIDAYREIGGSFGEGSSLASLGDVLVREGHIAAARSRYLRAPRSSTPFRTPWQMTSAPSSATWTTAPAVTLCPRQPLRPVRL
jgi:tetratricopeptide (TPR) repeat protein